MTNNDLLKILKLNLSLTTTAYDEYLMHLVQAAQQMIAKEGITLSDTAEDGELIVMYGRLIFSGNERRTTRLCLEC